ncbi:phage protein [Vibrio nitrifigilis]|uniref:Phage protein n=1 Tax=Vibrio nitrifigilis TaxID=2789781 RepID=A0ABS0GJK4_9VIBR|nr:phage protein [Vibrio nitrifigilis]MBF9000483.1 phage protein [Vibrio nitrifigilis]MBF9002640.1 phage protein [Vibrio nitrifigilis]
MKYNEMTKNYVFRELKCGLTIEETAEICFKTVRTVKEWDAGKPIPKECRRLMRVISNRELHHSEQWEQFEVRNGRLKLPTGQYVTPQQILTGIALLEIQSINEIGVNTKLLKYARALAKLMPNR